MRMSLAIFLAFLLGGCSVFGGKAAEEPSYEVVSREGEIEIREYAGYAIAETTVEAPFDEATSTGFRRLFGYISGENGADTEIAMTAPVLTTPDSREIAMTAPVSVSQSATTEGETGFVEAGNGPWTVRFVLPEDYDASTAPAPTSADVRLRDIAPRRVATIRFSGFFGDEAAEANRMRLAAWLDENGLSHAGDWRIAGYNPPWTIPFLRRNEVIVSLNEPGSQ